MKELKTLTVFDKPCVKHSQEFSNFFLFLHQFIVKEETGSQLIQSTNIKYKLCKSQNYLYDHYHSINRTKTDTKITKRPINKHQDVRKKKKLKKLVIWYTLFISNNNQKSGKC